MGGFRNREAAGTTVPDCGNFVSNMLILDEKIYILDIRHYLAIRNGGGYESNDLLWRARAFG